MGKKNLHIDQEPTQEMFQQTGNGSKIGETSIVPEAITELLTTDPFLYVWLYL